MFNVFTKYYNNVDFEVFKKDLADKDSVFLLKDSKTKDIKGFSTIKSINISYEGKDVRGVFSGDTVVEKEYWGQGTLGVAFLKYLFMEKLKKPFQPLYWYLISKGYKTYLLMANNFSVHYPRYEKTTPKKEQFFIDEFSRSIYGDHYDLERGVISFSKVETVTKDCLKESITPITEELLTNKRINFFANKNPDWSNGDELSCLAEMTFSMPLYYQMKVIKKAWMRSVGNKLVSLSSSLNRKKSSSL